MDGRAAAPAGVIGVFILTIQYFILLPPFAGLAERRERPGGTPVSRKRDDSLQKHD